MFKYASLERTKAVTSLAAVNFKGKGLQPKAFSDLVGVDKVDSVPAELTISRSSSSSQRYSCSGISIWLSRDSTHNCSYPRLLYLAFSRRMMLHKMETTQVMTTLPNERILRCRKVGCTFQCMLEETEIWGLHFNQCVCTDTQFQCPFVGCKDQESRVFYNLDEVYAHEESSHHIVVSRTIYTHPEAFCNKWGPETSLVYPLQQSTNSSRRSSIDYQGLGISLNTRERPASPKRTSTPGTSSTLLSRPIDPAFGNRVLGFVENQIDNMISLFSAEPGGSGPVLTKSQVTQLVTKVNTLSKVLERCDSGFRKLPISRPGSRKPGSRSVSVHFENKVSSTGMGVLENIKLQNMGSSNEQIDATSQCDPPASTNKHSLLRSATINIVDEVPSSNEDSSSDPENSNLRLSRKTWPIASRSCREQSTTGDEIDSDDSDFEDDKTGEPLLPHHVPLEEQLKYFRELDIICKNVAYDFYRRYESELSIVHDRRNQLVVKIYIDGPHCQSLPQWTNLLRSLATAKGIKPNMVALHTSFNGETQSVDEVRHALSKRKDKSDRDILALVQMARTFCWQLKDWKRCKELDVMYARLERAIAAASKEKREVKKAAKRLEARLRKLKEAEPGHRLRKANTFDMCANQKRSMDLDLCT